MYTQVSFYIVAHADDWQLFMQPCVYNTLVAEDSKVVFIITTAGDAGMGETFWSAREEGTKASVTYCLAPLTNVNTTVGAKSFHNHTVHCCSINNTASYFLRLPDGNLTGEGFAANSYESLTRLRNNNIETITAVDSSATYTGWKDFCATLENIISVESEGIGNICINYLNPNVQENPNDHNDHIATGQAIKEMTIISSLQQRLFVGYSVANSEALTATDLFWKIGMFAAYEKAVYDIAGYSTLAETVPTYTRWCLSDAKFISITP